MRTRNMFLLIRRIVTCTILVFAFIFGSIGNGIVIFKYGCRGERRPKERQNSNENKGRTNYHLLITILALCDLITSLTLPVKNFFDINFQNFRIFGYFGCQVVPTIYQITINLSQLILLLISCEHYNIVKHPLTSDHRRSSIVRKLLVLSVSVTVLFVAPTCTIKMLYMDIHTRFNVVVCDFTSDSLGFIVSFISILYRLTLLISIGVFSFKARRCLNQQKHEHHFIDNEMRAKRLEKSQKKLLMVVVIFTLFTFPADLFFFVLKSVAFFQLGSRSSYSSVVVNVVVGLNFYLNCLTVNVLVYSKFSFNDLLKKMIPGKCGGKNRKLRAISRC